MGGDLETTDAARADAPEPTFADLTTLRVGGPIRRLVDATTQRDLVDFALEAWVDGEPWMVLGGGSNLLVGDEGFDGTVIRIRTRGIEVLAGDDRRSGSDGGASRDQVAGDDRRSRSDEGASRDQVAGDDRGSRSDGGASRDQVDDPASVRIRVQAGEVWDDLVAWTVDRGFAGIEALSGIPGCVGAAPVQNIGAYGQELASTLVAIEFLDEGADAPRRITARELELGYRTSVLKQGLAGIVVSIELDLHDTAAERAVLGETLSRPVAYPQLAGALHVDVGDRVPLARVRESVLELRASKGMVLDPDDPDTSSAGSFFTNPIVNEHTARSLPGDAPRWYVEADPVDEVVPLAAGLEASPLDQFLAHQASLEASEAPTDAAPQPTLVKLSAAWLIEHAGVGRGFRLPGSRAAVSSKHTLALTNRGGASAEEVAQLARFVQSRVQAEFGILLHPEPVVVGLDL
ncbi:UDP-N-acetylmuramate dehydrogenase [Agromyces terreus]|uniref:UDP-N-acetylenolpyruvoylglucosamine reductase n=1 Tax=Agromyces terreus TaxID=424795 RepID=A0A9X2H5S5_9MICO|nr:UDP-N-acetylmuramate dehydrogenase [Agromyces terreus]MCP2369914.1 UDP-N-acetylmuramate dehydrogenase [Agromyces terreus]